MKRYIAAVNDEKAKVFEAWCAARGVTPYSVLVKHINDLIGATSVTKEKPPVTDIDARLDVLMGDAVEAEPAPAEDVFDKDAIEAAHRAALASITTSTMSRLQTAHVDGVVFSPPAPTHD